MQSKMLHQLAVNIQASRTVKTSDLGKSDEHQPVSLWDICLTLAVLVHLPDTVICLHIHNDRAILLTMAQWAQA